MSEKAPVALAYPRLAIAYFLQFAIWGSYGFALTGFVSSILGFTGGQLGWIGAAIPIGAIIAPLFVGPIADRYFPAQYVLAFLHLVAGALLIYASIQTTFMPMLIAMIAVGACYMPTIALMNSIVFEHIPNRDNAPRIFMFGTLGWIAIVLFIQAFFGAGATNGFFHVAAGCCFLLSIYALTLPNTPPKGAADGDVMGLKAFALFKKPAFTVFVLTLLLAGIPACGLFFTVCVPMLTQNGYPAPLALTTLNQISEFLFMAMLPIFVKKIGLKNVILVGIAAWLIRYVLFMESIFTLALIGLILHGFCYSFLYVAAYMYGDKVAPTEMKASVQSLLAFLILGVGQVIGSVWGGQLMAANAPAVVAKEITWTDPDMDNSAWQNLDFSRFVVKRADNSAQVATLVEGLKAAPAVEVEVAPVVEEAPAVEPAPVEPAPVVEEAPAVEPAPVEAAPVVEEAPAVEPAPVEAAPAVEEAPAVEVAPVEPAPVVEEAPAVEPAPAEAAPAVEEAAPVEPAPVEAAPAVEEAPVVEPAPVEAAPAVEEPAPAEEVTVSESTSAVYAEEAPVEEAAPAVEAVAEVAEEEVDPVVEILKGVSVNLQSIAGDNTVTYEEFQAAPESDAFRTAFCSCYLASRAAYAKKSGNDLGEVTVDEVRKALDLYVANTLPTQLEKLCEVQKIESSAELSVALADFQKATRNDWSKVYRLPIGMLAAGFLLFLIFGKNPEAMKEA